MREKSKIVSEEKKWHDKAHYVKLFKKHFFSLDDLTTSERRCILIIMFYLRNGNEFFYMTRESMGILLEAHFGMKYHEKNVALALSRLVKKGYFVEFGNGLCMFNFEFCYVGNRDIAFFRHYEFDLFGTRDKLARTNTNEFIEFLVNPNDYISQNFIDVDKEIKYALAHLRKASKIKSLK